MLQLAGEKKEVMGERKMLIHNGNMRFSLPYQPVIYCYEHIHSCFLKGKKIYHLSVTIVLINPVFAII